MTRPANKPTIPEVAPLIAAYYNLPNNGAGGSLHIVLDDANVERHHAEFCREYALEKGDWVGAALANILTRMSTTQRKKLAAGGWKRWGEGNNGHDPEIPQRRIHRIKTIRMYPCGSALADGINFEIITPHSPTVQVFHWDPGYSKDLTHREPPQAMQVLEQEY